jgi:ribose transport system substrate-binding protein
MKKRKLIVFACISLLLAFAVPVAFAGTDEEEKPKGSGEMVGIDRSGDHYAFVSVFMSLDYYVDYYRAVEMLEEEWPGVKIEILGPADYDIEGTLATIEQTIAKGVDGLLVMPWGEDWLPTIQNAVDAGIPVVFLGVDYPEFPRLCYVGSSNFKMGVAGGEWIAERINYKGKVAVMRSPVLANVTERWEGFMSVMERYPDIKVVADLDHDMDSNVGAQQIVGVLQKHPDLAAVWGGDGISGPAAAMGIRESGAKPGSVIIVGSDREDALLASIEEGEISATVIQGGALELYAGVKILDMYIHKTWPMASYDDQKAGVALLPDVIYPKNLVITQENVKYFKRDYAD